MRKIQEILDSCYNPNLVRQASLGTREHEAFVIAETFNPNPERNHSVYLWNEN